MQKENRIFLIFKLPWCHARRFFELAGEVRNILEAAGDGNVTDAHFTFGEKLFGVRNPAVDDVVDQRTAGILLKKMGQIIGVQVHHGCKRIAIQLSGEVRFDICFQDVYKRQAAAGVYQSIVGFILVLGANLLVRKIDRDSALI